MQLAAVAILSRVSSIAMLVTRDWCALRRDQYHSYSTSPRCAVDQQSDEPRRYSIERPNKSVALIVMNIRTWPTDDARPFCLVDFGAGNTALPLWAPRNSIERFAQCCPRHTGSVRWLGVGCSRKVAGPSLTQTRQKTSICNASMSHWSRLRWMLSKYVIRSVEQLSCVGGCTCSMERTGAFGLHPYFPPSAD